MPFSVLVLSFVACPGTILTASAADQAPASASGAINYFEPAVLTGTIYAKAADPKEVLFTFKRTATRSGQTIRVLREFMAPDGKVAARERIQFEGGQLASFEMEEPESGATGSVAVVEDTTGGAGRKIVFSYSPGKGSAKKTDTEKFQEDTLVSDMIAPWLAAHWATLNSGAPVKFRYAVVARKETVGFKFIKESEGTLHGIPVVTVKMEPTSWVIARLVDPLHFTVEKGGQHRVLQYVGRTTPRLRKGDKWEDLDAVSVYDWK
jgi:hypothetical protein